MMSSEGKGKDKCGGSGYGGGGGGRDGAQEDLGDGGCSGFNGKGKGKGKEEEKGGARSGAATAKEKGRGETKRGVVKCAICLEGRGGNDNPFVQAPCCGAVAHKSCVHEWLSLNSRCFVCHVPVTTRRQREGYFASEVEEAAVDDCDDHDQGVYRQIADQGSVGEELRRRREEELEKERRLNEEALSKFLAREATQAPGAGGGGGGAAGFAASGDNGLSDLVALQERLLAAVAANSVVRIDTSADEEFARRVAEEDAEEAAKVARKAVEDLEKSERVARELEEEERREQEKERAAKRLMGTLVEDDRGISKDSLRKRRKSEGEGEEGISKDGGGAAVGASPPIEARGDKGELGGNCDGQGGGGAAGSLSNNTNQGNVGGSGSGVSGGGGGSSSPGGGIGTSRDGAAEGGAGQKWGKGDRSTTRFEAGSSPPLPDRKNVEQGGGKRGGAVGDGSDNAGPYKPGSGLTLDEGGDGVNKDDGHEWDLMVKPKPPPEAKGRARTCSGSPADVLISASLSPKSCSGGGDGGGGGSSRARKRAKAVSWGGSSNGTTGKDSDARSHGISDSRPGSSSNNGGDTTAAATASAAKPLTVPTTGASTGPHRGGTTPVSNSLPKDARGAPIWHPINRGKPKRARSAGPVLASRGGADIPRKPLTVSTTGASTAPHHRGGTTPVSDVGPKGTRGAPTWHPNVGGQAKRARSPGPVAASKGGADIPRRPLTVSTTGASTAPQRGGATPVSNADPKGARGAIPSRPPSVGGQAKRARSPGPVAASKGGADVPRKAAGNRSGKRSPTPPGGGAGTARGNGGSSSSSSRIGGGGTGAGGRGSVVAPEAGSPRGRPASSGGARDGQTGGRERQVQAPMSRGRTGHSPGARVASTTPAALAAATAMVAARRVQQQIDVRAARWRDGESTLTHSEALATAAAAVAAHRVQQRMDARATERRDAESAATNSVSNGAASVVGVPREGGVGGGGRREGGGGGGGGGGSPRAGASRRTSPAKRSMSFDRVVPPPRATHHDSIDLSQDD